MYLTNWSYATAVATGATLSTKPPPIPIAVEIKESVTAASPAHSPEFQRVILPSMKSGTKRSVGTRSVFTADPNSVGKQIVGLRERDLVAWEPEGGQHH